MREATDANVMEAMQTPPPPVCVVGSTGDMHLGVNALSSTIERTLRAPMKSPILLAFNLFAANHREELRALGTMTGADVEKTIGERWKGMRKDDKDASVKLAQEQQEQLKDLPFGAFSPDGIIRNKKRKKSKCTGEKPLKMYKDLTGMQFEAVVDGEFDSGFFLTAKVAGCNALRGVLFKDAFRMGRMMGPPSFEGFTITTNADGLPEFPSAIAALAELAGGETHIALNHPSPPASYHPPPPSDT